MSTDGPGRGWYGLAVAGFLLSLLPAYLLGRHASAALRVDVVPLTASERPSVGDLTVWGPSGTVKCRLNRHGVQHVLPAGSGDETTSGGRSWTSVADVPAANLVDAHLRCTGPDGQVPAKDIGLSAQPPLGSFTISVLLAFAVPVLAALTAAIGALSVFVLRRRAAGIGPRTRRVIGTG